MNKQDQLILCTAINAYGENDHPLATPDTLEYFDDTYVIECLVRLVHAMREHNRRVA